MRRTIAEQPAALVLVEHAQRESVAAGAGLQRGIMVEGQGGGSGGGGRGQGRSFRSRQRRFAILREGTTQDQAPAASRQPPGAFTGPGARLPEDVVGPVLHHLALAGLASPQAIAGATPPRVARRWM